MIVTEQEAGTMWCPFSRVLLPGQQSGNRISSFLKKHATGSDREFYEHQQSDTCCIGSRCMAWRWKDAPVMRFVEYRTNPAAIEEPVRPDLIPDAWLWRPANPADGDPAGWLEDEASHLARRKGGCGLVSPTAPEIATAVLDSTMG